MNILKIALAPYFILGMVLAVVCSPRSAWDPGLKGFAVIEAIHLSPCVFARRKTMRCRKRTKKPGDIYLVTDSPLPVFHTRIHARYEYKFKGPIVAADDSRVQERQSRGTMKDSPAYSCLNGGCLNPPPEAS